MSTSSTPVDRIRLSGLSARGYHGVLGSEREEGQLFVVDVVMGLGPRGSAIAAVTDSIEDAVDYGAVASAVVDVIEGEPVNLIETLASRVADAVLDFGRVQEVEVTVHKPQAPIPVAFDDVTVTITRTAHDAERALAGVAERRADRGTHVATSSASAPAAALAPEPPVDAGAPAVEAGVPAVEAGVPAVAPLLAGGLLGAVNGAVSSEDVAAEPVLAEPVEVQQASEWWSSPAAAPVEEPVVEPQVWALDVGAPEVQVEPVEQPVEVQQASEWWSSPAAAPVEEPVVEPQVWAPDVGAPEVQVEPVEQPVEQPVEVEQASEWWSSPAAAPAGEPAEAVAIEPAEVPAEDSAAGGADLWPAPALSAGAPVAAGAAEVPAPERGSAPAPDAEMSEPAVSFEEPPAPVAPPVNPLSLRPAAPAQVVLALGANVGKVLPTLRTAVRTLSALEGLTVSAVAPLARTTAVTLPGAAPQPDYLNTVLLATTTMSPLELLDVCHDLEAAAGRVRTAPWGPRALDIDLVSFEGVTSHDSALVLPHPRAAERAFVLVPWSTADPFAELAGRSVSALAETAPDRGGLRWLALDWLDSDRLPALPTGEYVVPPADDEAPGAAEPVAPVPAAAEPVAPEPAPAEPVAPEPAPAEPVAPVPAAAEPAVAAEPQDAPAKPPFPPTPAPHDAWATPMNWNDVIRGNHS